MKPTKRTRKLTRHVLLFAAVALLYLLFVGPYTVSSHSTALAVCGALLGIIVAYWAVWLVLLCVQSPQPRRKP